MYRDTKEDDPVILEWEKTNRMDGCAHKVLVYDPINERGTHVGYVDRNQAARIVSELAKYKYTEKTHRIVGKITRNNPGKYNEIEILGLISTTESEQHLKDYYRRK
ncbi:hypothetical protein EVB94_017 [Rhizobium phage RHph_TM40]|nr:hypothetical protein EVB94_017 [Rhizobium phage RHph_TM40]QIG71851.1 hypothetical protein EVB95_017 [Rhizobium phage RHph_TM2_3B]QIG72213.1 hypothetical protein EVB96_017 [Rhizobium phage RHph_TM3_3_6]